MLDAFLKWCCAIFSPLYCAVGHHTEAMGTSGTAAWLCTMMSGSKVIGHIPKAQQDPHVRIYQTLAVQELHRTMAQKAVSQDTPTS